MRILIAIDSMHDGGAARVVSVLANQLAEFGHSIYLGTNLTTRPVSYELHKNISRRRRDYQGAVLEFRKFGI